jgi:hypothetical protein
MRKVAIILVVGLGSLLLPRFAAADDPDDILIIANPSAQASGISLDDIRSIFLKKRANWPRGGNAVPINARKGSALRGEFVQRVLNMTLAEESNYWKDEQIKSGLTEPAEFSNVLKAVFKLRGSIGYVYRSEYREGVAKILYVLKAHPTGSGPAKTE